MCFNTEMLKLIKKLRKLSSFYLKIYLNYIFCQVKHFKFSLSLILSIQFINSLCFKYYVLRS